MTIAYAQYEFIGARTYAPEGPYGASGLFPLPSVKPGTVVGGDAGSEFIFLIFSPTASLTLNQGDVLVHDNSFIATQSATGSGAHPFGANVVTFFMNGRTNDPAAAPSAGNAWSYLFPQAGQYGIWCQRAGISLANIASINAQSKPVNTTATAGRVDQPAAPLAGSMGVTGMWSCPTSGTFTGTTATGSTVLTAVSTNKFLVRGQTLSGTGIATGAVITDIQGSTVTMSIAATAAGSVTITAANNSAVCTTTNGSAVLTNVTSIAGIYPNQTIAGTGIPGSTTILSISGNSAPYSITMSANASATANNIAVTTTGYYETFLDWPYIGVQN